MRIFGRFLYALLMVGLFLLTYTYTMDLTANKFYEEVFGASLTDENSDLPEYYYFYTSIPDYHKSDPLISIDIDGYEIRGYEVLKTRFNNDNELVTEESIYIIIYSGTKDLSKLSYLRLANSVTNEYEDIYLSRFKTLNLINAVTPEGTVYLAKDLFLNDSFDKIKLVNKENEIVVESDLNLLNSDFTIKQNIEDYFLEYQELPQLADLDKLQDDNISTKIVHVGEDYRLDSSIIIKGMLIYFGVLIVSTYLIFFQKRKYR